MAGGREDTIQYSKISFIIIIKSIYFFFFYKCTENVAHLVHLLTKENCTKNIIPDLHTAHFTP